MNESQIVSLLKDLIALPSVNPSFGGTGEGAVADYVEGFLHRAGLQPERQKVFHGRDNIIARVGGGSEPPVLLEAHMDTVAAEGWLSGNPFCPLEQAGRIYGRGACDTKASLAVFMAVAHHFTQNTGRLKQPLVFAATVDEEEKQAGAFRLMETERGLAGAITGEPTRLEIIHAHKGVMRLRIRASGLAAHAAFPERGNNAILQMAPVLGRLATYQAELNHRTAHPSLGRPTVNVGTIRGGQAVNVVPDDCVIDIDRRLLPTEKGETVRREFETLMEGLERVKIEAPYLERSGIDTGQGCDLAVALGEAVRRAEGNCRYSSAPYMTNATAYAEKGIACLVFGPGDIAQAHTRDEFIEISQLGRAFRALVDFLGRK